MTLEQHATFAAVRDEWDDLAWRVAAPPFLRAGWFEAWWKAFGSGSLEIVALRREGRLVAVLPLSRRLGALRSLANWHQPLFGFVAEDAAARRVLACELLCSSRTPLALRLVEDPGADCHALRAGAHAAGGRVQTRVLQRSPYLDLEGDWPGFHAALSTSMRSNLRRRRRRLAKQAPVSTRVEDRWDALDDALAATFALEQSRWKAEAGTAIASKPATLAFYTQIARWAAAHGWLRIAFLDVGGRPIASELMLEHRGVLYGLKGGYDPAYRAFGPGVLIRADIVADCFERGVRRMDLLGDSTPDKLVWTNAARDIVALDFFPRSAAGALGLVCHRYGRPMAKRALDYAVRDDAIWRQPAGRRARS